MANVSAILLAAGQSRRMGGLNKLGLTIDAVPMITRMARTLLASRLSEIVVVLGHEAERIRAFLGDLPLTTIVNTHYRDGQMTSVHVGLAQLTRPCDGVMVCLGDLPLLQPADIDSLIEAFESRRYGSVLVPTFGGQRGNPIVLANAHREAILAGNRNLGCKRFIEKNPELVETFEMDNDHTVFDLDTPAKYRELLRRLRETRTDAVDA
ncbi:MAG: nucleotidyltransferase family protein [Gammaproteobacteria bacterium]|nr:nucleotidyltransferase family protein [Gammaproteobacteria bacterium]